MKKRLLTLIALLLLSNCSSTQVIESPKTTYISDEKKVESPQLIWSGRKVSRPYEYLGTVKSKSFSYNGAIDRFKDGAKKLGADALIDIRYEKEGFLTRLEGQAITWGE